MNKERYHKILIVDDVPENVKVLIEVLKDKYMINVATNGFKGIEIAKEWRPDLILLDIMMPEMDGYEVCNILKNGKDTKHIPIIFLTALSEFEDEYKGLSLGAVDYISKPYHPELVKARIKNYIKLKDYSDNLETLVDEKIKEINKFNDSFIETLALIAETRDSDLGCHIKRCREYARIMVNYMGEIPKYKDEINVNTKNIICKAVALHDIGKIGIPDNILFKEGKLTEAEFEIMKGHSYYGYKILENAEKRIEEKDNEMIKYSKEIAYYHHEQWDGNGYPTKKKGEEIPLAARIMMIIDVFDAIVSKRIYKSAKNPQVAIDFIKDNKGIKFDPDLVEIFLKLHNEFLHIAYKYADTEEEKAIIENEITIHND